MWTSGSSAMPSRCRIPKLSCGSDARLVQPLEHLCLGFGAVPDSTGDAGSISHLQLSALAPFVDHPTLRKATVLLRRNRNEADVASSRVARTTAAFSSRARTISMISIVEAASATTSSDTRSSATNHRGTETGPVGALPSLQSAGALSPSTAQSGHAAGWRSRPTRGLLSSTDPSV